MTTTTLDRTTAVFAGFVALVLVAGFVVLTIFHIDTVPYALFLSGPVVTGLFGALINRKVAAVQQDVASVKDATNGALSGALSSIGAQLDAASTERQGIAAAVAGLPPVSTSVLDGPPNSAGHPLTRVAGRLASDVAAPGPPTSH